MTFLGSCTGQLYHKMCMKHNETIPYMDDRGSAALCDILSKRTPQPTDPAGHLVAGRISFWTMGVSYFNNNIVASTMR